MLRRLWQLIRSDAVLFASDDIKRVFLACRRCDRIQPHYRVYAPAGTKETGQCRRCGHTEFTPRRISEWHAAWRVLVVGYIWRKTVRGEDLWDPRLPVRAIR